ncbi:Nuclear fragile X mental retardation-interacting 1 [Paramuricea clavata]|uniref:Nuclear fragile X mental retardation-interacting 1 n=1 Tax=Paramuricea clavata TaxID=317549 RepID=A0A6S7FUA4_PARCT|nr:Nuclear fragile X mental retardation-interacting 1 [Paramuricea clavata]
MNGCPRSQFHLPPQYGGRQTIPFHTGFGAFVPPPMPHGGHGSHSYFGRPTNGVLNGYSFQQASKQAPNVVQRYLDSNCNESHGNYEMVKHTISLSESSFQCEPCKKSFQDENILGAHLKTHIKCEFPNCSFIASRQTLKLHEIQCHREGNMKIVLDTPEQIAKWREERKRNYPTVTNMAKKEAEQQRRIESGQILTTKEFRYNRKQGWKQQRGKRDYKRGRNTQRRNTVPLTQSENVKLPTTDLLHETQSEKCTLQNGNLLDVNSKGTEREETAETLLNLGSLAADYATSSSDEDDGKIMEQKDDTENPSQSEHYSKPENKRQKLTENIDKHAKRKSTSRKKRTQAQNIIGPNRLRPTLLEMLLASDIRHERNAMLQCIRFIVKKNFFGIE